MTRNLIVLLLVIGAVYYWQQESSVALELGEIPELGIIYDVKLSIKKPPLQEPVKNAFQPFSTGEYTFTPLARFQAAARVLGTKHYSMDREASLAPVDLALGWGPMAKREVLNAISISQSGRFYYWRTDNFPIPRRDIETNSANMHFIPATPEVGKKLRQIRDNDEIKFKGYLVRVDAADGWRWISSTTRNDTGDGACELVLIDDISLL
jgi:hypothetical protein